MKDKDAHIARFIAKDRLGALMKAKFVSLNETECMYEYEVDSAHFNPGGILHGGALFSVMDSSQGMLMLYVADPEHKMIVTGTATVKYSVPVHQGTIRLRSFVDGREGRKYFVRTIASDAVGNQVAQLDAVWVGVPAT